MIEDGLAEMANFCIATGYTPEQYRAITLEERNALVKVLNKRN